MSYGSLDWLQVEDRIFVIMYLLPCLLIFLFVCFALKLILSLWLCAVKSSKKKARWAACDAS